MKLVLLLILLSLVLGPLLVESGKIVRTWRRSSGPGRIYRMRPIMRRSYYAHPWEFYRRQRNIYIPPTHFDNTRRRHHEIQRFRKPHQDLSHHGFPIQRDPTTHYAPPAQDAINLGVISGRRSPPGGRLRPFRPWRRPRPPVTLISLWKLLAMRQRLRFRRRRPFPLPPPRLHAHESSEEAEVAPVLTNFVYFLPKDTIVPTKVTNITTPSVPKEGLKPGYVSDVPLYPTEVTSTSEFKPVINKNSLDKVNDPDLTRMFLPDSTTPSGDSTQRSAPSPDFTESTEKLLENVLKDPPSPINSFNINIDPMAEGSEDFIKIIPSSFVETETLPPGTTIPTTASTITTESPSSTTSTTFKPIFAVRVIMPPPNQLPAAEEPTTTSKELDIHNSKELLKPTLPSSKEKLSTSASKEVKTSILSSKESEKAELNSKEAKSSGVHASKESNLEITNSKEIKTSVLASKDQAGVIVAITLPPNKANALNNTLKTKTTARPAPTYKWPTMKLYSKNVRKPPVYIPSKVRKVPKTSSSVTSSESTSISITGVRSKVKEYKPSILAKAPGMLTFDKVDTSGETEIVKSSTTSPTSSLHNKIVEEPAINSSSTTTISPMQNFDPMKMIHSWLTKAKSS